MAYTNLATQIPAIAGIAPAYSAAVLVDGNMFTNTGKEFIHVKNAGAGAVVVTFPTPATTRGLAIEDKAITVGAGAEAMIGRFDPGLYNQSSGADKGKMYVTYDQVLTVTVGVFQ